MTLFDIYTLLPTVLLIVWALLLLMADLFIPQNRKSWTAILAAVGFAAALGFSALQAGKPMTGFGGMIRVDDFAVFLNILFAASGLAAVAIAYDALKRQENGRGEYYVLLLLSVSGAMLLSTAADLIIIFLGLELLSIPLYVLAGFARPRVESEESALKYFLLGTFASAIVLFGIAWIFGAAKTTHLQGVMSAVSSGQADATLLLVGAGLLLAGFAFKIAAVPFHAWTPDVYEGAPTPVTGYMAVAAKAAGFAALLRVFITALPSLSEELTPVLAALAALTMIVGNVVAVSQKNIKRLLAYSSIANAGYILMAFVPFGNEAVRADSVASALFYLMAYAFTTLGAWAVVVLLEKEEGKGLEISDYAGLGKKYPLYAAAMAIFMLSYTGIPMTLGFWGKFYLFRTAIQGGYLWLAIIGLVTSLVSAFYYLRVIVVMFFQEGQPEIRWSFWVSVTAFFCALCVIALSFLPGELFGLASRALMLVK